MTLLAIDTATAACSAAVWVGDGTGDGNGAVVAHRYAAMSRGHAESLVPMIAEVLAAAGLKACALDRLAVTVGPGAFTGLRVGLATARGLALATGKPLIGLTTFEVILHALPRVARRDRLVLVAVDSRREELFLQLFEDGQRPLGPPWLATPARAVDSLPPGVPLLVAGDGAPALSAVLADRPDTQFAPGPGLPDAAVAAALAASRPEGEGHPPRPLYLRAPDAVPSAGTGLQP